MSFRLLGEGALTGDEGVTGRHVHVSGRESAVWWISAGTYAHMDVGWRRLAAALRGSCSNRQTADGLDKENAIQRPNSDRDIGW